MIVGTLTSEKSRTEEKEHTDLETVLLQNQRILSRTRWIVALSMLTIGALCHIVANISFDMYLRSRSGAHTEIYLMVNGVAKRGHLILLSLAPLPDAMVLSRFVLVLQIVWVVYSFTVYIFWMQIFFDFHCVQSSCIYGKIFCACHMLALFCYLGLLWRALLSKRNSTIQNRMWNSMVFYILASGMPNVFESVRLAVMGFMISPAILHIVLKFFFLYMVLRHDTRQRMQAWVMQAFGAVGVSAAAAAAIAGLLGATTPHKALVEASSRFRAVNLATLSLKDFLSSPIHDAHADLYALTETVLYGACDAFISHSWHDCPEMKWSALQRWRSEFVAKHGREPRVWLDKCCVDQDNIEADLRCLPIFLSGCKELVVLSGSTYLTRLWCVMELFTFTYMRGDLDKVVFMQLSSERQEQHDPACIEGALAAFNVQDCNCSKPEDLERMLAIVLAAFGDVRRFNEAIRALIVEVVQIKGP